MIRALNENDLDQFIEIRKFSLISDPKSFGSEPNQKIDREQTYRDLKSKNDEDFILGYFEKEKLFGIAGFKRYSRKKTRHKGFVWGVFIYPEYRGKGIGKKLILELISRAEQLSDLQKIMLSVMDASEAAIGLYKSLGFEIWGVEKSSRIYEGEPLDEIYMEKKLPL